MEIVPRRKVVSPNPGEWTSPFEGKGYEPRGYRDFEIGDNPRQIHLPTSARRGIPTIVERVALRDLRLLIVVDVAASMSVRQKLVIEHEAAAVMLYAAWQGEATFGLALRTAEGVHSFGLGVGSRHFYFCYRILWQLLAGSREAVPTGSNIHLRRCLPPGSMLVYCSDFLAPDDEERRVESLLRAVSRYDFVPVVIQDRLESGFPAPPAGSLVSFADPGTSAREDLWVSQRTARKISAINEARFRRLLEQFRRKDIKHIHPEEPGVATTRAAIHAYFRQRRREAA